ncbi:MAG: glycogen-binding domain-containing protein [Treponema sp.]|jgi:hypothetical protein|nr:glycogen-binding domain-containing protein [Treponema sp.]
MKAKSKVIFIMLLSLIIGTIGALDTTSYQFINHLVNLKNSGAPEAMDDGILFTAPATYKKVGIAFAHEGFSKVYWFQKLLIPDDAPNPQSETNAKQSPPVVYKDSGILFFTYTAPAGVDSVEYRLIINGLWTTDPSNPNQRIDESGLARSIAPMPKVSRPLDPLDAPAGVVTFRFDTFPHETIYVAGSFNNWDPFMYEMKEKTPGHYELTLSLPPGTYQYAFFYRGERHLDQNNRSRVYRDGRSASQTVVQEK